MLRRSLACAGFPSASATHRGSTVRAGLVTVVSAWSVLLASCASQSPSAKATRDATGSVAGPSVATITVDSDNGGITVTEDSTVTGVEIDAEINAYAATAEAALARANASTLVADRDASGNVLIRVDFPEPRSGRDSAVIKVRVASVSSLDLSTMNGGIRVTGLTGPVDADTTNGGIEVQRHAGSVTASTSNGRISVENAGGAVTAKSSNGKIEISLADGNGGAVNATTSNGAIDIELPRTWQGSIEGHTSNGNVEIVTPGVQAVESAATGAPAAVASNRTTARSTASTTIGDARAATATARTSNGAVKVAVRN